MALNALQVQNAKGRDRPYKVADSGGLYLFVQPSGQRYWRLAYRWDRKQRTMALGVYPDVSLAAAREKRDATRKMLASGRDPVAVAREEERAAKLAEQATFKVIAQEWFSKCEREGRADITLKKQQWLLDFAYPKLGDRPIARITAHEVYEVLKTIEAKGHHETARRLRGTCGQVFRYAVATGRSERDVCADLRGALVTPKVKHLAAITNAREVGELMEAIDAFDGYRVTHAALRLAPHLFVRPGELRHAEWAEFDFKERVWAIPAEKMKMRRPHFVPLSRQALAILDDVRPVTAGQRYVFPCQGKRDRPMCENTLNLALQRLGYGGGRMTAHGFRAMASTLLNESGRWTADAIERQLGHVDANAVRRVYARGEYWPERIRMMQAWSDELNRLRAAASFAAAPARAA
ncbi:tyrosine-type recombinase/integrase [Allosphingosinicella deserti]|uniref:tyrosine-type recombinase/integrase n=1 Tax=Allosphingosinicella deserti TaxID=2116704 RepID=UPI0026D1DDF6